MQFAWPHEATHHHDQSQAPVDLPVVGRLKNSKVKLSRCNQGTEELPALQHLAQLEQVWIVGMGRCTIVDRARTMHAEGGAVGPGVAHVCRPTELVFMLQRMQAVLSGSALPALPIWGQMSQGLVLSSMEGKGPTQEAKTLFV